MPTRGELTTGSSISSPHGCLRAHFPHSHPMPDHWQSVQTRVAAFWHYWQAMGGGSFLARSPIGSRPISPSRSATTRNASSVVVPKSYS